MSRTPEQCLDEAERMLLDAADGWSESSQALTRRAEAWVRLGMARASLVEPEFVDSPTEVDPGTWHQGTHERPIEDRVGPPIPVDLPTHPSGWDDPDSDPMSDVKQAADKAIGRAQMRARRPVSIYTDTKAQTAASLSNRTALQEAYDAARSGQL